MVRLKIKELLADKEFSERRHITMGEVCEHTGIGRTTLSRMMSNSGQNTTTEILGKLCKYFDCQIHQVAEYIPDES